MPPPPRKRLGRAALLLAAAAYLAFLLLFELPSLDLFPSSDAAAGAAMPTHRPRRRELEASASSSAFASPVLRRPATAVSPAPASAAAAAAGALPIFSSLLLLPRPNATATPFDGTAAEAFAAARPHLDHLRTAAAAAAEEASSSSTAPTCPTSISVHADGLPGDGVRTVELPCGLAVGSHVTVVARPRAARPEYDPKIAERKSGQEPLMVSQFMVELVGTKAVDGEAPPRILHFNPRIRGDYSGKPVIEMNSCYRMQWGQSQRCEGYASRPADETGELAARRSSSSDSFHFTNFIRFDLI